MSRLSFVATRPVAITMFILALAVFGGVSLVRLPMDLLPEISYPTLTVRTAFPGAAPEDVEDRVSVRIQESLSTLPGLVRTTSISRAGFSDVVLEFDWGTRMTFAVQEVRDRLDGVRLPDTAERPLILRYDPNLDPILRMGVSLPEGKLASEEESIRLRWLAENRIKRELEGLEGVAAVQVRGGLQEEILVKVDPNLLAAKRLDPATVANRLAQENLNASGGQIREGSTDYLVRALGEFQTVEEIKNLAIESRGDTAIRVSDVATVTRTHAEREVITRLDGTEAIEIAIFREAGANIVDVAESVHKHIFGDEEQQERAAEKIASGKTKDISFEERQKLNFLAWNVRDAARIEVLSDQSTFIGAAVKDVRDAALVGALLAIAVMWFFLRRLSTTLIIGVAIPISVIVTFAPMYIVEVSLNIMSLGGLALGIGMLVDNAIVVLESITRCREEGDDLATAAVRGVSEVAGAITASTLTTVAVFAPIVFVHGIAGQIFGDQAVTVVSSLLVSLVVAVLFIPMLASRSFLAGETEPIKGSDLTHTPRYLTRMRYKWTAPEATGNVLHFAVVYVGRLAWFVSLRIGMVLFGLVATLLGWVTWPIRTAFDWLWRALDATYPRVLRAALAHPLIVLAATSGLTWFAWGSAKDLGMELLPEIHQGEFTAHVGLAIGTPIDSSDVVFKELDREVSALEGVSLTALTVGVEADTLTREIEGDHTARLTVLLEPEHSSADAEELVANQVRRILQAHPEVRSVDIKRPTPFTIDAPIAVEVRGHDLEVLGAVAEQVRERMTRIQGLTDVRTSVRAGHPEARITFDRDKTLKYGLDMAQVSDLIRDHIQGNVGTRFVEGEERIDIRVKGDESVLSTIAAIEELVVNPTVAGAKPVRLSAIARIDEARGPAEIRRIGNGRAVVVTAASTGIDLGGVTARIEAALADLVTPSDVLVELGGQKREMEKGTRSMQAALLLAIFLVYVVMASQFESLLQPFVILFSVPLAGVGVVLALAALDIPLSVVVFIGLILLAGIVVNNAIVLVDRINQKRDAGLELHEAIMEAGRARLRPILMTTSTTVLGLIPLTGWLMGLPWIGEFGAGEGAELRAPMAITVIAGLTSSTLLTLVVVPVIYRLVAAKRKRRVNWGAGPELGGAA